MFFSRHASTAATVATSALFASTIFAAVGAAATKSSSIVSINHDHEGAAGDADAGILMISSSSSRGVAASSGQQNPFDNFGGGLRELRGKCSQGYVNCVGGYLADSDRSITCVDACMDAGGTNPLCCDGDTAPCDGTTGKICKDGSCNGNFACNYAVFEAVVNGCKGESACDNMGYYAAHGAGEIINSCDGYKSCYKAGYGDGGGMRGLENSCNANQACQQLGDVAYGPVTTDLKDCCNISQGCYQYNDASIPTECKVAVSVLPNFLAHFIIRLSRVVLFLTLLLRCDMNPYAEPSSSYVPPHPARVFASRHPFLPSNIGKIDTTANALTYYYYPEQGG